MEFKNKFLQRFLPAHMEMEEIRKRQFFGLCAAVSIPTLLGVAIVDYIEEDWIELGIDIFIILIISLCLFNMIRNKADKVITVYRIHLSP